MSINKKQLKHYAMCAFLAGLFLNSPATAQEPGNKTITPSCYTVVTNSNFRENSPFGANGPKAQRMAETAAHKWSKLFIDYNSGWGGPTFLPLPANLSNPCTNQSSSPEDIVELDPIYCAIKDFSDCSSISGCNADLRRCPLEVCYGVDPDLNYNTADWPTVPGTSCQVQWQSAAYDIDNHQILVGPIPLGEEVGITGGTMVPGNWHENYSKAAVFVNQDKNWDFDRYNYTETSSDAEVESAIREVLIAFEKQLFFASDVLSSSRDFYETMLHEFGHVIGLQHTTGFTKITSTLSVMRPDYYVSPQLRATDIKNAQAFTIAPEAQSVDISVSLLRPAAGGKNHEHTIEAFGIPGDGTADSGVLDAAFTLENLSNSHATTVRISYCRSGNNYPCSLSDEIYTYSLELEKGESKPISELIPYSETMLPSELFVIAELTHVDGTSTTEEIQHQWNNGFAWGLGVTDYRGICGDTNGDEQIDLSDILYTISYLYLGAWAPRPILRGDNNGDNIVDLSDIIHLINFAYYGGPEPIGVGCTPPA